MLWTHPKLWKWKWLGLQIGLPLLGPIALSAVVAGFAKTMEPSIPLRGDVIVDVTPWALIFFTMALLGGGLNDARTATTPLHPMLVPAILFVAGAVLLYSAVIVSFRLEHPGVPGTGVWVVTFMLLAFSMVVCHEAAH